MLTLESKTQTSATSLPLGLSQKESSEDTKLSFSDLLRGISEKKDDKIVQNGVVVLALDEKESKSTKIPLEINPEISKDLSPKELKVLIKDAKEYLKNKITQSEGFKKSEIQALPKTLKGLVQVAQKFGIDIGKITLQEVKSSIVLAKPAETQDISKGVTVEMEDADEIKVKVQGSSQTEEALEIDVDTRAKKVLKNIATTINITDIQEKQVDEKPTQQIKSDIKVTPLFKAQAQKEITTEQLVNTKISTSEVNIPKKKVDETLKLLLRGERISKSDKGFTADFSVATARVLAPEARKDVSKSLESLLKGETKENSQNQKIDGLNIAKADSFEIKLSEAKQMTKYLSVDVKTAIEDYKSPFTRIKVALNPQRLGLVELTVVQRGKNLHINLSSNNAAINALALNANDLKVQLTNSGINNASLNFNDNSQSSQQGSFGQAQQNSQHEREAAKEYRSLEDFENEEKNEEILNSLEIVVPYYA
ncbi:MAG: flagellar hook-length control protein FliK [Sulfurimonas sp.]|nr:flagellar hook-length control protein FliK [Sulfurimonas sp.]